MHPTPLRIVAALAGFATAFLAGRSLASRFAAAPSLAPVAENKARPETESAPQITGSTAAASVPGSDTPPDSADAEALKARVTRLAPQIISNARFDEFMIALRAWAALEPEAALAFAREHLNVYRSGPAVYTLLSDWARRDPTGAWQWAGETFNEEGIHLDPVLAEIGMTDPETATRYAAELAAKHPQQAAGAYSSALRGILHQGNHEAALRLLDQAKLPPMPDGAEGKFTLADTIASLWGTYEPEKAAAWALTLPAESIARDRSLVNLGQNWAENDPEAAADFALTQPPGAERNNLLTQVLTAWLDLEPARVAAWMNAYLDDPALDNAKVVLARRPETAGATPSVALAWAQSITDPNVREYSVNAVVAEWAGRDLWSAMDYLYNSPELPSEMRDKLIHSLTQLGKIPALP